MDIAAAKKRWEAATEGDWFWNGYDSIWAGKGDDSERIASVSHLEYGEEGDEVPSHGDEIFGPRKVEARANAEFIAHARTDLSVALEALEEAQANQHNSEVCVPLALYDESNTKGRQLVEAVIPLLDAIRGCDNEIVLEVVRPYSGIVGDIIDAILRSKEGE